MVLDEESSYLATFNSPFGRYRFKRMPFGLNMSQDIFQAKIDQTFEGCRGVVGIADDIVISGTTEKEHDQNLRSMMSRCQDTGLRLNPDKCLIKQEKIKFYVLICGPEGIQPDPDKVSALEQMAPPTNSKELQTFLGLATYMAPFIPNLSHHTASLRQLLKKENKFAWDASQQDVFDRIKNLISEEVTLTYFDPEKETVLQVDASTKGLGATLLQEDKPVAFASKALTDVESRYANIERELLAVVYGCEKFHTYLYGRSFTVQSDHKPLESIHLKHLTSAPPRLQRMLLRLQPYSLTIKYRQGADMEIADALSRLSPQETEPISDMDVQIHEICPQFSSGILQEIRVASATDPELKELNDVVYNGWPTNIKQVPEILKPYWTFRDEITTEDGIAMKGQRIIIPHSMQSMILTKLHAGHQGSEKTKLRARTSVYWRGMNSDIEKSCKSCNTCQEMQNSQPKEPLIQTEIPPGPWHTIGTDLFYLDGAEYLLVADYYSKYQFVREVPKGKSSSRTIANLTKEIFSEQGIPKIVRSDNGPHFEGQAYKEFAKQYQFQHITSSPHYPRSNGFIESQVKTTKKTMKKARATNTDPLMALLCLRATPINSTLPSPAELLFGRPIQDNLPKKIPKGKTTEEVTSRLLQRQATQKYYHDRNTKPLQPLKPGQSINIQDQRTQTWKPAEIKEKIQEVPRSYIITKPGGGGEIRRNRTQIRERPQDPMEQAYQEPSGKTLDNPEIPSPKSTQENHQYTTRSGRIVVPPTRLDM